MKSFLSRFVNDASAVSAIEYALLGGLIAVVIVAAVGTVGSELKLLFIFVKDQVVLALQ
ncbi:Flp family type IVb pilin [Janthinobacterium fluminis]|uniref:Flp family type IVb pilin n=1 Tax=Janthinobacterium fluminis TaxID=2987524 RepID=A0ABT5K2N3_9BURK|nr:Flp family type IVb pilin [Janthinobacterium fluminis]MDC8759243.1 Flp family type IVb pilin [Janthinobacterium fluminis]